MKNKLLNFKVPTLLGLLFLVVGLFVGIWLVGRDNLSFLTKAGPTAVPKNVKVTNKGSNRFTVSWTTDIPVSGLIRYSQDPAKINTPAGDSRDQVSGTTGNYEVHYVDITGLSPGKIYYFVIVSGSGEYNDGGNPYQVQTYASSGVAEEDVASGKVVATAGQGINGAVIYMEIDTAETLSAITDSTGGWRVNIGDFKTKTGQVVNYDKQNQRLSVFVQAGSAGTATAIATLSQSKPMKNIVLGQVNNFISDSPDLINVAETVGAGSTSSTSSGFAKMSTGEATPSSDVRLINPIKENDSVAATKPELKGVAPPGTKIKISVHSDELQSGQIITGENGEWSWTPPNDLEPGNHTITLEYTDASGILQKITRNFVVLAADKSTGVPAYTATPSATPTVVKLPETTMPSTSAGVPSTGSLTSTITLSILGLSLFIVGVVWQKKIKEMYE